MLSYALRGKDGRILVFRSFSLSSALEEEETLLYDWVREIPDLKKEYTVSRVVWSGFKSTLVPEVFFNENQLDVYTRHLFEVSKDEILKPCNAGGQKLVFAIHQSPYYAARSKFQDAEFVHQHALNLDWVMNSKHPDSAVFAFFDEGQVQVIYMEDARLRFQNCFEYSNSQEACYFVLNTFEQMKLSRERLPLFYLGIPSGHEIIRTLETYIGKSQAIQTQIPDELSGEHAFYAFLNA